MPENQTEVSGVIDRSKSVSWEDVKKSSAPTSEQTPAKEEPKAEVEPVKEPEPAKEPVAEEIDYKSELEKWKDKAKREETSRKYERDERKRLEKELSKTTTQNGASEEVIEVEEKDLDEIVERKLESFRRQEKDDVINDVLLDLSDNPHEQELVRTIYESKIRPSGFSRKAIREDLEQAMLIANRGRLEEVAFTKAKTKVKADLAKERAMSESASTGASQGRQPPSSQTQYSPEEQKWLSRVGKTKVDGE